jgi:hypothetical protein
MEHAATDCETETEDDPYAVASGINPAFADALEQAILGELGEMRELMLGMAREVAGRAKAAETAEDLTRLNTAAVKAARAHRQISVLQLEMLGKRPIPGRNGASAGGAAGQAGGAGSATRSQRARSPNGTPFRNDTYDDYDDYDDHADDEDPESAFDRMMVRLEPVLAAMDEDFVAAGHDDIPRKSPQSKFKLIYYVPHPATDRAIAASRPEDVCAIFNLAGLLPPVAGTGPPEVWERFIENRRLRELHAPRRQ